MSRGSLLILHDAGASAGGRPWLEAFRAAGWEGPIAAPDLPGHGNGPDAVGGYLDPLDAIVLVTRMIAAGELPCEPLEGADGERRDGFDVVVGVGVSGWSAQVLALGGRASALVLVDGLGRPFLPTEERVDQRFAWQRDLAANADAAERTVPAAHGSRAMAMDAAAHMSVPALLLESGGVTDDADLQEVAAAFASGATLIELTEPPSEAQVAEATQRWRHAAEAPRP